jgi:GxxExxY protein
MKEPLTYAVIGSAMEVHRCLGPGLLESAYEECLCHELQLRDITFKKQQALPLVYKGLKLDHGFRVDILIPNQLVVEVKSVDALAPVHEAQLLTYLRLTNIRIGLLFNFNVPVLKDGIKRMVLD